MPLEATLDLYPQASASARLEVSDPAATLAGLEASALDPFMADTSVSALALTQLDSPASSQEVALSDQAAREAHLAPLAPAREQAPEAAAMSYQVHRAPEAFPADPLPLSGAARKALAPMALAETSVVTTMDFLLMAMAMAMTALVWATATD